MNRLDPTSLEGHGVRLEPMAAAHVADLATAASDGQLWELCFTSVPNPEKIKSIGYTWYASRWQRSHVNTACKLLLMQHAFEKLGCAVVGFRTDNFNFRSQRAIESLGAKRDGVIRHHHARPNGTVRDSVFYSVLALEWLDVKRHLQMRLHKYREHIPATQKMDGS